MKENPIRDLLAQGNWGEDQALLQGLRQWQYAPVLWQAYETLQEEALFHSQVHGPGHIHRVLLLAARRQWSLWRKITAQIFAWWRLCNICECCSSRGPLFWSPA